VSCFICVACGVQYLESGERPPERCAICEDERQYIPQGGQRWIATEELGRGHHNEFRRHEDRLVGVSTSPSFAIGQRGLLVLSPQGNVLWDCISLLDEFTERTIRDLGGIAAIAISHPHYYSALADWAAAFDARVYLHAADRQWVMRDSPAIVHWEGDELDLHDGMKLVNAGGHFDGGAMLHVPFLAGGRGALLTGDIIQVIPDRRFVSFMYSYPNLIPLGPAALERISATAAGLEFDRIYGAWWDREIATGARAAVARSARRYLDRIRPHAE
jgi:hypothetical protein